MRKKRMLLLVLPVALFLAAAVLWMLLHRPDPVLLKVVPMTYGLGGRSVTLRIYNESPKPIVVWQPCYIERKPGGKLVAASGVRPGVLVRGKPASGTPGMGLVHLTLTGDENQEWRAVVPISRYGVFAALESLMQKPAGWALKLKGSSFFIKGFRNSSVSDWMIEPPPYRPGEMLGVHTSLMSGGLRQDQTLAECNFLAACGWFYRGNGRWPTNLSEVRELALGKGWPTPSEEFAGAKVFIDPPVLRGPNPHMRPAPLPPNLPEEFAERIRESRQQMETMRAERMESSSRRMEDIRTLSFIVQNFRSRIGRYPRNMSELSSFIKRHQQPELPDRFTDAAISATDDGFEIVYDKGRGRMTVGASGHSSNWQSGTSTARTTNSSFQGSMPPPNRLPFRSRLFNRTNEGTVSSSRKDDGK